MAVVLQPMSVPEFADRRVGLIRDTADSLSAQLGLPVPEAEAVAERATAATLPLGPETPDHLLRTAVDDGRVVGWIWISMPGTFVPDTAWISDVEVDPPFRSQGYGRAIMLAGEAVLTGSGIDRVGLNVDGRNERARRLYEKLGYAVTRQQWALALGDLPRVTGSPVTLSRDGTATVDGRTVGRVAYTDHHRDRPGTGWITEFTAGSRAHRAAIIVAVGQDLLGRGARSLGTEVAGDDRELRALVEELGFRLIAQQMTKRI